MIRICCLLRVLVWLLLSAYKAEVASILCNEELELKFIRRNASGETPLVRKYRSKRMLSSAYSTFVHAVSSGKGLSGLRYDGLLFETAAFSQ